MRIKITYKNGENPQRITASKIEKHGNTIHFTETNGNSFWEFYNEIDIEILSL